LVNSFLIKWKTYNIFRDGTTAHPPSRRRSSLSLNIRQQDKEIIFFILSLMASLVGMVSACGWPE